jgi:hypothetical protein
MTSPPRPHPLRKGGGRPPPRIAVIGAGMAGAACAAGLRRAGADVTVFDKSRGVGGRMATRRAQWADADGLLRPVEFDHGCPGFTATGPRFRAVVDRAEALGAAARWRPHVDVAGSAPRVRDVVVPTPNMPALCRHLLGGVPLRLGQAVTALQRSAGGWNLHIAGEGVDNTAAGHREGPFAQVVLAVPPAQAAQLLAGHHDDWAATLAAVPMAPCWTLMAVTDALDWRWDIAEPEHGVLAWVGRDDRKPGRASAAGAPHAGLVQWVAHATPAWSLAHLEDDPVHVTEALLAVLGRLLTGGAPPHWRHTSVHRWRYAQLARPAADGRRHVWNARLGLAVCGDSFGDGSAEAAWCSGDSLADAVAASLNAAPAPDPTPTPAGGSAAANPVH